MTDHRFDTPHPVRLYAEIGRGEVRCRATGTAVTTVEVGGPVADQVSVTYEGDEVTVVAPRQRTGFFGGEAEVVLDITLPAGSDAMVKTGSADIELIGEYAGCVLRSGSGEVDVDTLTAPGQVETGSGDVRIRVCHAELRVKSGSGDVRIGHAEAGAAISTGSGDIRVDTAHGPTAAKTGSGDLVVGDAHGDVSLATASGDLLVDTARRGRITMQSASGDVQVGVPAGLPVWTDVSTLTGELVSTLPPTGEPENGADYLELRAKTVSGDIALRPA
jgi:DUF4097 and DUF4098 domain-containing protein YvlB